MKHTFHFQRQAAKNLKDIGAIFPCSDASVQKAISVANLSEAKVIVELGCGSGVFTREIVKQLRSDQIFFAIEINPDFVRQTKALVPDVDVYTDSAESIQTYLHKHGVTHADCIISTLPWTIFSEEKQKNLMDTLYASLSPGGKFITIAYVIGLWMPGAKAFYRLLKTYFSTVKKTEMIWNLPPTIFYYMKK